MMTLPDASTATATVAVSPVPPKYVPYVGTGVLPAANTGHNPNNATNTAGLYRSIFHYLQFSVPALRPQGTPCHLRYCLSSGLILDRFRAAFKAPASGQVGYSGVVDTPSGRKPTSEPVVSSAKGTNAPPGNSAIIPSGPGPNAPPPHAAPAARPPNVPNHPQIQHFKKTPFPNFPRIFGLYFQVFDS